MMNPLISEVLRALPKYKRMLSIACELVTNTAILIIDVSVLYLALEGSIYLKNRHFFIQERFNKLIYGINTIIKYGI